MIHAEAKRIVAIPVSDGNADGVVRVLEVFRRGVHVELGEQGGFHAHLQAVPSRLPNFLYKPNVSPKPTDAMV